MSFPVNNMSSVDVNTTRTWLLVAKSKYGSHHYSVSRLSEHIMLNKAERYGVLNRHRIFCELGLLPVEVDLARWKLNKPSLGKRIVCFLSFVFFVFHVLYKSGGLAYAYFLVPETPIHHLVIHGMMAVGGVVAVIFYAKVYICNHPLLSACYSVTLLGNVGGHMDPEDRLEKPWTERMKEYSLQDLMALVMPCMYMAVTPVIIGSYLYDTSMLLLLYASIPGQFKNLITFGVCALEELRYLTIMVTVAAPIWQMQVVSYDLVCKQLECLIRRIQNGIHGPRRVYRSLRCLQIYVAILNSLNSDLVFVEKLTMISMSVLCGYAAVAHFRDYPVFGIMFYMILLDLVICYTAMHRKAFRVPKLFEQSAATALLQMRANRRQMFGKQMLSIPPTAIKVGNFNTMERASTLIFIDFVVVNIVNMLVAYA